jgi:myosin-15
MEHLPTMKEVKFVLPKPALTIRDIKPPQWVNLVQSSWKEIVEENGITPVQAKAQVLGTYISNLKRRPLQISSFISFKFTLMFNICN